MSKKTRIAQSENRNVFLEPTGDLMCLTDMRGIHQSTAVAEGAAALHHPG
jgi:hypothetical protein